MRSPVKRFTFFGAGLIALLLTTPLVFAQTYEQYLISAKAGGVNLVSGTVLLKKQGETEWRPMRPTSELEQTSVKKGKSPADQFGQRESLNTGDAVKTEGTGRFEVLLNPGSYLRLGENSEFELVDSSLDNLRIILNRGSAILEATGSGDIQLMTEVITPQTRVAIIRSGLYRVNVLPTATELFVRKGRAVVGNNELITVKGGKKVVVEGGVATVAKFDKKKQQDAFDFWSKNRAEMLMAANRRLSGRDLSLAILNSGLRPSRSNLGLWVYDPVFGTHTFLPFYAGWHSPYGSSYDNGFGYSSDWYRPRNVYSQSSGGGGNISTPVQSNPEDNPQRGRSMRARKDLEGDELPVRPVRNDDGGNGDRFGGSPQSSGGNQNSSGNSAPSSPPSAPVYTPPPSPPARSEMPESPRRDSDGGPRGKQIDPYR